MNLSLAFTPARQNGSGAVLNFAELVAIPDAYQRVPRIEMSDVRWLWHSEYWDGAISGMLLYQDAQCWFERFAENDAN
ncbi:MAG TPA: hypothetical protein VHB77_03450, partial [Planctomycetaceae bacterium]|nr:hypothetical protein [Planctomycetaceae bacterium]